MLVPFPWEVPHRLQGIDVSGVQPRLPLAAVATANVHWFDVKASESTWADHMLATHVADARSIGRKTGAYHFLHSSDDPIKQGDAYLKAISGLEPFDLRPTLDWEDWELRIIVYVPGTKIPDWPATITRARIALNCALSWLHYVHEQTGRRPTIYTGKSMTDLLTKCGLDLSPLLDFDLWVAHYRWDVTGHDYGLLAPADIKIRRGGDEVLWVPRAWQCCGNGGPRIAGVPFDLDRDVFFGDEQAFIAWCSEAIPLPSSIPPPYTPPDPRTVLQEGGSTIADEVHSILSSRPPPLDGDDTPPTPTKPEAPRSKGSSQKFPAVVPPAPPSDGEDKE